MKGTFLIITFIIFCTMTRNAMPYSDARFNRIEIYSGYNLFITANIGVLMISKKLDYLSILFGVLIMFMQIYFVVLWCSIFSKKVFYKQIRVVRKSIIARLSSPLKKNKRRSC